MDEAFNESTSPYRIHSCLSLSRRFYDACVLSGKHGGRCASEDPQIPATGIRQIGGRIVG